MNRFLFWVNVAFLLLNMYGMSQGSFFSAFFVGVCAYNVYTMRRYA